MDSNVKCATCGESFSRRSNLYRHIRHSHRTNLDDDDSSVTSSSSTSTANSLSAGEKLNLMVQKAASFTDFVDRLERAITNERMMNFALGICSHPALLAACKEIEQNVELGSAKPVSEALQAFSDKVRELYAANGGKKDGLDDKRPISKTKNGYWSLSAYGPRTGARYVQDFQAVPYWQPYNSTE